MSQFDTRPIQAERHGKGNKGRSHTMGDKGGKKDKNKGQKQKETKQEQKVKKQQNKQQKRTP